MDSDATSSAGGLKTVLDTIAAPKDAFERLRTAPTWGWALAIAILAGCIGTYLIVPAFVHAFAGDFANQSNAQLQNMTPEQRQRVVGFTTGVVRWSWLAPIVSIPIGALIAAAIMAAFNAIGRGSASFASLWAAAANIAVPTIGISALVGAAIVLARGADGFNSSAELQAVVPSLAMLVPASATKLHAFAAALNPFSLWGLGLNVTAMSILAKVSRGIAWATGLTLLLLAAGIATLGAR